MQLDGFKRPPVLQTTQAAQQNPHIAIKAIGLTWLQRELKRPPPACFQLYLGQNLSCRYGPLLQKWHHLTNKLGRRLSMFIQGLCYGEQWNQWNQTVYSCELLLCCCALFCCHPSSMAASSVFVQVPIQMRLNLKPAVWQMIPVPQPNKQAWKDANLPSNKLNSQSRDYVTWFHVYSFANKGGSKQDGLK